MWEVFKGGKGAHVTVTVDDSDCEVSSFNQLKDFRIRVDAVVDVVLSNLNQVDDRVTVVGVCTSKNDTFIVELFKGVRLNVLALAGIVVALLSLVILLHRVVSLGGLQGLFSL